MKNLFLVFIAALFVISGCSKSKQFTVAANIDNADNQNVYLCKTIDGKTVVIDTAIIVDKKVVFTTDFDDPQMLYALRFEGEDECGNIFSFFSENNDITATIDRNAMQNWTVKGSPAMDSLYAFHQQCMAQYEKPILALYSEADQAALADDTVRVAEIYEQMQPLMEEYYNYRVDYIKNHSDSFLAHYMLDELKTEFELETVKELAEGFTTESVYSKRVKEYIEQNK